MDGLRHHDTIFPLFLFIALGIRLSSPGPILYRADRVGLGGAGFTLLKFRSMHVYRPEQPGVGEQREGGYIANEKRIFPFGGFLRKCKLDELPQLINVFVGDMSLVGPRPEVRHYVDYWTPEQMHVLDVRPGITDPASIRFRNENELLEKAEDPEKYYIEVIMQEKLKLYLDYVQNHSFVGDIALIFKTFWVIVTE